MPRRGECIYKRKDGRWEARYIKEIDINGKKKYGSVYAKSYRAVTDKQLIYLTTPIRKIKHHNIILEELFDEWFKYIKNNVKPSTFQKYEGLYKNHIHKTIGQYPVLFITRNIIEDFTNEQLNSGRVNGGFLARKTVNDILVVLGLVFDFAQEQYDIQMPKINYLKIQKKEARVLTEIEERILVKHFLYNMDVYKLGSFLTLYTGIRIGELCALRWEDISNESIMITKTMQRLKTSSGKTEIIIGEPKSASSKRCIPLPPFLLPYLDKFRQSDGYVLQTSEKAFVEPRLMQLKFQKLANECKIDNVSFHTLRHTFATRCVEAGFDIKSLSEILGHADVKTTLNRYVHSSFEFKQINMSKLSLPSGNNLH